MICTGTRGTETQDVRGRTRHGIVGAILATLMLTGQAGAQVVGCNWTEEAFWDGADLPAVERCIAAGADIGARDTHGGTPLHLAAGSGTVETVQALIDAGANIEARAGSGWTPLHRAAAFGTAEMVEALIAAGADIGVREGIFEFTPLHLAAAETVQALTAAGADIEARGTIDGWTPLHRAAAYDTAETVEALIAAGADIRAQTEDGRLAVDLAEDNEAVRNHPVFWTLNEARYD
ncbi:MAG: ankyrin repeat domain-containing protein [Rhodospirillales bacterium]|nr:ankyrin repeat domain-containing protein [Rhodospirillales bacterium]